jgi:cytochrome P450
MDGGDRQRIGDLVAGLGTPAGQADPYPLYTRLRAFGPAVGGPDGTLFVTGYRECTALLRDTRLIKRPRLAAAYPAWRERPALRLMFSSILMINPPEHTRLRRLVTAAFTGRRVATLRPAVERIVADLCEQTAGDSDFVDAFAFPLPVRVIGELLGVPAADRPMFQSLVRDWTMVLEAIGDIDLDRADAAAVTIRDYLAALARDRRAAPADDLLSALTAAVDAGAASDAPGRLDEDELVTMAALLLAAGFETTTLLLANGLLALLRHPDQADRLRTEPDLAPPAVEELLRFDSPVQLLSSRTATAPMHVGGLDLAADQQVITLIGAANHDPQVFTEPGRLRLDRAEEPPVSFGGGIHLCLGAALARLEAQVALPALLARFPHLELAGPPAHRAGLGLHGVTSLPVSAR